jgi:hypothetical protein
MGRAAAGGLLVGGGEEAGDGAVEAEVAADGFALGDRDDEQDASGAGPGKMEPSDVLD